MGPEALSTHGETLGRLQGSHPAIGGQHSLWENLTGMGPTLLELKLEAPDLGVTFPLVLFGVKISSSCDVAGTHRNGN